MSNDKHDPFHGLTADQITAVLSLSDAHDTAPEPQQSPLLKVLRDIAGNLEDIAASLEQINARDSVWRRA
jgi:hypothetical protein